MTRTFCTALLLLVVTSPAGWGDEMPPEIIKQWQPLPRETFEVAGSPAFLVRPKKAAEGNPWIVYAPTFQGSLPAEKDEGWMFGHFLKSGIAIAGIDVGESYGSPDAGRFPSLVPGFGLVVCRGLGCHARRSLDRRRLYNRWVKDRREVVQNSGIHVAVEMAISLSVFAFYSFHYRASIPCDVAASRH